VAFSLTIYLAPAFDNISLPTDIPPVWNPLALVLTAIASIR